MTCSLLFRAGDSIVDITEKDITTNYADDLTTYIWDKQYIHCSFKSFQTGKYTKIIRVTIWRTGGLADEKQGFVAPQSPFLIRISTS